MNIDLAIMAAYYIARGYDIKDLNLPKEYMEIYEYIHASNN